MRPVLREIADAGIKVVSNAGGINPHGCAKALAKLIEDAGLQLRIAVVEGDDVNAQVRELIAAGQLDMFTAQPLPERVLSANAYLGALPIAEALAAGADIVITGRCVDSAVTLGPLMHEFGWSASDFDRLAGGSLAGHIIECGCQATGGLFTDWQSVPGWATIGYPIVECRADGSFTLTKPAGTGGLVARAPVAEQLLYEIGDPGAYALPDVICDFRGVTIEAEGDDRVRVAGARGLAPTDGYKVSATAMQGFRAAGTLVIVGIDAAAKARRTAEAILERTRTLLAEAGLADFSATHIEVLGAEASYGPHGRAGAAREVMMRVVADHAERGALEIFAREIAPAGTSWSPGTTGPGGGRPSVSPLIRPLAFMLHKSAVDVSFTLADHRHPVAIALHGGALPDAEHAARAATLHARRRRRRDDDAAADPPRLGAQRRQGQPLEHRRHRPTPRVAAAALGPAHAGAGARLVRLPDAGRGRALLAARHRRDQLPAARRARRRRPGVAPARSARQGHGADAARHADRGAAVDRPRDFRRLTGAAATRTPGRAAPA